MATDGNGSAEFGSCCESMKEMIGAKEFDSFLAVAEDGILYMSVGMVPSDDGAADVIDHPIFFCPFCGAEVQTEEQVEAKSAAAGES